MVSSRKKVYRVRIAGIEKGNGMKEQRQGEGGSERGRGRGRGKGRGRLRGRGRGRGRGRCRGGGGGEGEEPCLRFRATSLSPYQHCNQHPHHCSMQTLLIEAPPCPRPQRCELSRRMAFQRPTCPELRALLHIPRPHNKCVCVYVCVCACEHSRPFSCNEVATLTLSHPHA